MIKEKTNQLADINKYFSGQYLQSVSDDIIDEYEKTGFVEAAKQLKAVKDYKYLKTEQFNSWLSSFEDKNVSEFEVIKNRENVSNLIQNPATGTYELSPAEEENRRQRIDIEKAPKTKIKQLVQQGLDFFWLALNEKKIEEYKGIPPMSILPAINNAKGKFDDIVVMEPLKEQAREVIKDPLICGKLNSLPDFYFLITYWYEDIKLFA